MREGRVMKGMEKGRGGESRIEERRGEGNRDGKREGRGEGGKRTGISNSICRYSGLKTPCGSTTYTARERKYIVNQVPHRK